MTRIDALVAHYGLFAVLLGAAIEGETVVATGGLFAHRGILPLQGVMAAAALGSFLIDQVFFLLGRYARHSRFVRGITDKKLFAKALGFIERHPISFIFAFRFMWGFRTISPIALGTTAVSARLFILLNGLAAILWAVVITAAAYAFAGSLKALGVQLKTFEHHALSIAAIAVGVGLAAWLVRNTWQARG